MTYKLMTHAILQCYGVKEMFSVPFFLEDCGHGGYIGSAVYWHEKDEERKIDVYIYDNGNVQNVCIRFGDYTSSYLSPGTPIDFLVSAASHRSPLSDAAAAVITKMATATFNPLVD